MEEEIIEEIIPLEYGDMYLKFTDEAEAFDALNVPATKVTVTYDEEGVATRTEEVVEGEFVPRYENLAVDIIGVMYNVDNTDPENPIATPLDGWHVNTRGLMYPELEVYSVVPETPRRVWA